MTAVTPILTFPRRGGRDLFRGSLNSFLLVSDGAQTGIFRNDFRPFGKLRVTFTLRVTGMLRVTSLREGMNDTANKA